MNKPKTILILGAGGDQLPYYREARKRGLMIVGVDKDPKAPGFELADKYHVVSTRDYKAIEALLRGDKIDGIIAPASDASQMSYHYLSDWLDTPTKQSSRAALASMDKGFFLARAKQIGLTVHRHFQSTSSHELERAARELTLPLVVKPSDASGSKGMTRIDCLTELKDAIEASKSICPKVILEEWVDGDHYSAEFFVDRGRVLFHAVSRKELGGESGLLTKSHSIPAYLSLKSQLELRRQMKLVIRHFDIESGAVNIDFVVGDKGDIHIIELGARPAGNGLNTLVAEAYGVDLVGVLIDQAIGESFSLDGSRPRVSSIEVLSSDVSGTLKEISGVDVLAEVPELVNWELLVKPGDAVRSFSQSAYKLGYVILTADSDDQLAIAKEKIDAQLVFQVINSRGVFNAS